METIKGLVSNGVLKIRTHTDSTEKTLMTLEALLEVKEEMKDYVDIQVVAFPQDGIFSYKGMDQLMVESIEYIFDLANKYGKLINMLQAAYLLATPLI